MADEDNSTPAAPPAETTAEAAAAVDEAAVGISSIAVVEDGSDDDGEVPPPPPAAAAAAPIHQFNFNPPPPAAAAANAAEPHLDFANLNPAEINAQFLSLLPPCIHPRLDKLKALSEDRTQLLEQYLVERAQLEQKYSGLMKPLYEKRRDVVMGALDEDIAKESAAVTANNGAADQQQQQEVKGIPQFWACAMGHIDVIAELITDQDVDCLDHLMDITCDDFPDGSGFELHFHFSENDFFTNTVLTKRYEVPNLLTDDEPMLQNVTGTKINWKPNKSLTHRTISKKQRKKGGKNAGQVRTVQKTEKAESFFHFFTPPKMPELGDVVDEEEADAMEEHFDHDYEVACAVRGSLIPNAVHWFTGEAVEDMMYGDDDMVEEEGEDGEDVDGEVDGAGNGGFVFNPNGAGNNPFPPPAPGNGENPECQQN
jgi:nucleosome assembly protein 1-like 1